MIEQSNDGQSESPKQPTPAALAAVAVISDKDFAGEKPISELKARLRRLIGPSVFRDPSVQLEAEEVFTNLITEFRATTGVQTLLANNAARLFVQLRKYHSTLETAVAMKRAEAARGVIDFRFHAFYPPPAGVKEGDGMVGTAYGAYMASGGSDLFHMADEDAVAEAIRILAVDGLPETALDERARVLALPELEKLERIIASKHGELEALLEHLMRLLDRLKRNQTPAEVRP